MATNSETRYPLTTCPQWFQLWAGQQTLSMPCCWSHPLTEQNDTIQRVVIIIHGVLRNADEYYPNILAAVELAGAADTTLVIAPQFLLLEDITRFGLPPDIPYWGGETGEGWKKGDDSISTQEHPAAASISAFDVVDQLIRQVSLTGYFPNLKNIVVAGHSAGGQYVNRYAAGTQIDQELPKGIHLRFIVANPSTFVYFNAERRVGDESNVFAVPTQADTDYDDYKYGLKNLNRYMSQVGADLIRQTYPQKDVVYLLGGEDTREAHLEQTPNAMLQGANRLARGQIYYHYLQHLYGESIRRRQKIAIIPCVGHDHAAIFKSKTGLQALLLV
jgi:hypothetical protein